MPAKAVLVDCTIPSAGVPASLVLDLLPTVRSLRRRQLPDFLELGSRFWALHFETGRDTKRSLIHQPDRPRYARA